MQIADVQSAFCNLQSSRDHQRTCGARTAAVRRRSGITLLEVVIALAIFLGAVAVISEIVSTGSRAAIRAQLQSEAVLRAETRLHEVVAGVYPLEIVQGVAFEDDPKWQWSLLILDGPHPDVLHLEVTAAHVRSSGTVDAEFTLARLMRDPLLFIDAAASSGEATDPFSSLGSGL